MESGLHWAYIFTDPGILGGWVLPRGGIFAPLGRHNKHQDSLGSPFSAAPLRWWSAQQWSEEARQQKSTPGYARTPFLNNFL